MLAQYSFTRIWDLLEQPPQGLSTIYTACKSHPKRSKCDEYYFYGGGFDPIQNLSVDFLFKGFQNMLNLNYEEKISCLAFKRLGEHARLIPLGYDKRQYIQTMTLEHSKLVGKPIAEIETTEMIVDNAVQRKIIPWELLVEAGLDLRTSGHQDKQRHSLIVVASLISKSPNLGGLCRTCEIFSAEKLIVHDLKVKQDPQFTSTCVTADHWMPMEQVSEKELCDYLAQLKSQGWSLIGVEQASNSVSLETFKFPKKCALLLGDEKKGIPASLLYMLDHIVEIPQFGVIRSLNVHVSGSLLIWEYVKQHH